MAIPRAISSAAVGDEAISAARAATRVAPDLMVSFVEEGSPGRYSPNSSRSTTKREFLGGELVVVVVAFGYEVVVVAIVVV